MRTLLLCTATAALLGGCTFYFGGDDGDDICAYPAAESDEALAVEAFRNPDTGWCEDWWGGGGGGGCGAVGDDPGAPEPQPDWASCYGFCEGLGEADCLATPTCRAAYLDSGLDADCAPGFDCGGAGFLGCWGTAPSGAIQGACEGLDAYQCSRHDDCTAHYVSDGSTQRFSYCAAEGWTTGCYSDMDCALGYECNADEICASPPGCGGDEACPAVCYGYCEPATNGCELVDCAAGYHCELTCYDPCDSGGAFEEPSGGCDPICEPSCVPDISVCEGVECPSGQSCYEVCTDSFPGECWAECAPDDTTPACETLVDEAACDARADCVPLYTGYGCSCDEAGACTCTTWEYARCETAAVMP